MIDEKEIEEAARRYSSVTDCDKEEALLIEEGFKGGVNWAVNESLKGLWHPASEEPKFGKGRLLVLINGGVSILNVGFVLDQLRNLHNIYGIEGWLYLDDLLPKEGGEDESV